MPGNALKPFPGFFSTMKFNYIFRHTGIKDSPNAEESNTVANNDQTAPISPSSLHCHRNGMLFYAWFEAMHTRIDIAICDISEENCLAVLETVSSEINRIELMTDRFNRHSELSRLNLLAAQQATTVSDELYAIIADCINFYHETAGAFDITIQSLNNYRDGINDLQLNASSKSIYFRNSNVRIDLCGYIKGYALDRIIALFNDKNIANALINMGNSSIAALGDHPNGNGWKITHPSYRTQTITLFNECLSSSGNSENNLHVLNPSTGLPAEWGGIHTIITPTATEGEVKATALCVKSTANHK